MDLNNEKSKSTMINTPDYLRIVIILLMCAPFMLWSVLEYVGGGKIYFPLIIWIYSIIAISGIINAELIHRPKSISIEETGIELHFRIGKTHHSEWSEIEFLDINPGVSPILGRFSKGGQVGLRKIMKTRNEVIQSKKKKRFLIPVFHLTYEIAEDIREDFFLRMGKYPDTR